ncbi:Gfo/Idh/MocA family oxidoreductase [Sphingopyxis sp.]|jgi:predicted dehydrogenase|uniref:Gfo/Idh/MocA family protein n=1 Tax=Sphingopyxis sp. TaxID=1908224 RepID=UPI002DEFD7AC|nr:Gfo/Idh/MocA family oxidoreductase [Sphingopyxis sp.]
MQPVRIGLIGASRVALHAATGAAAHVGNVEVIAVASRDFGRALAFAKEQRIERAYGDYTALLNDPDVDLVYIGTPPSHHAEQALAAITAGKSVLVEKPFSLTAADAVRVRDAAAASGVRVFEAMHSPHHRLFQRISELVSQGELGHLKSIDALFEAPIDRGDAIRWSPELGGGALMDLGVYPLAFVRRIAGEDFEVKSAEAEFMGGVDARFEAVLAYDNGLECRIAASMIAQAPAARLRIEGEDGWIEAINPVLPQLGHRLTLCVGGQQKDEQVGGPSSFEAQLAAVAATLSDGASFPVPEDDFVASMVAIERLRASFGQASPAGAADHNEKAI